MTILIKQCKYSVFLKLTKIFTLKFTFTQRHLKILKRIYINLNYMSVIEKYLSFISGINIFVKKMFSRDRIVDQLFNFISFAWCCHFQSPFCGSFHWTDCHWPLLSLPWLSLCRSCSRSGRTGGCGRNHRLEERSQSRRGNHSSHTWHERYGQESTKTEPWFKREEEILIELLPTMHINYEVIFYISINSLISMVHTCYDCRKSWKLYYKWVIY